MSIGLVMALLAMTSAALAILLLPLLWRQRKGEARQAYDLAVYRDQLAEIDRDVDRGLLTADQAEAGRTEIGRRILALGPGEEIGAGSPAGLTAATLAILLLPIAVVLLYSQLGSPALPDQPFAERSRGPDTAVGNSGHLEMNEALARLTAHLQTHPQDLTAWLLLGRSEVGLGRYDRAVDAYRHAVDLSGQRADIAADWGEAQVLAAGGTVTAMAQTAFETALKDPESSPKARYYLALALLQGGDANGALKAWRDLAASAPQDADWLPVVRQRIADATAALGDKNAPPANPAATPEGKAIAEASPETQRTMINAMVERLAARLASEPDDPEGWARLGRSYMVLNQPDKAREAYARAVKLKPDDAVLRQALAAADTAAKHAGPDTNPPAAVK